MTYKKFIFCLLFILSSTFTFSQNTYDTVKNRQNFAAKQINKSTDYFGAKGSSITNFQVGVQDSSSEILFKVHYTKDKTTSRGRTYYNVKYKIESFFKDLKSISEDGSKLVFKFKPNRGYIMDLKVPTESWIGFNEYKNDLTLTIYNSEKRKKLLTQFRYLLDHPYYDN